MATGRVPTTANSPLTAKGDLFGYSTTQARVPVGNNGETIVADSSTSTGLRYTAGNPIPNPTLNSCFDIWQRGTSFTPANSTYTADRWAYFGQNSTNFTVERVATGDTTNLPFIQYAARLKRASGATSTNQQYLIQSFESANSIPFAGKTVTYSFYARAGANYSATSNALFAYIATGTGTDQNALSGYTGSATPISTTVTLTTTWQRFTITGSLAATTTELATAFIYTPSGTAGANDYFEVTGVQIDIGSVALPVRRNGGTIQGELAACQRYYYRNTTNASYPYTRFGSNFATSTTVAYPIVQLPVTMRTAPTSIEYANLGLADGAAPIAITSLTIDQSNSNTMSLLAIVASGLTTYRPYNLLGNNSSTAYLAVSAEL
jgi:hypothetical protein